MEKTVYIDGKAVRMRTSARIHAEYRQLFGKDLISEIDKFKEDKENGEASYEFLENLAWLLAKKAGEHVYPEGKTDISAEEAVGLWLDSFDSCWAILKAAGQIFGLYSAANKTHSKKRKKTAPR